MPLESLLALVEKLRKRIDAYGDRLHKSGVTNSLRAD